MRDSLFQTSGGKIEAMGGSDVCYAACVSSGIVPARTAMGDSGGTQLGDTSVPLVNLGSIGSNML